MDIEDISIESVFVEGTWSNNKKIKATISGVVLAELIQNIGSDKILDEIGKAEVISHFDIEEAEETE